ncbi:MAG: hypothetical protein U7127_08775 [Phormidium sp.]
MVQTLLKSLKQETPPKLKRGNLSRLRGIAKNSEVTDNVDSKENNWWLKVAGSFENDPTFDEAVRLGQEWFESVDRSINTLYIKVRSPNMNCSFR